MAGAAVGSVLVSVVTRRLPSWLVAPVSVLAMLGWTAVCLRVAATDARRRSGWPCRPGPRTATRSTGLSPVVRSGLAGTAVVVALAALLGPAVAALVETRPVDPRRYVQPPQVETLDENPLIRISGWALNPEQELFQVATDLPGGTGPTDPAEGAATDSVGVRIRLAVLSDYDGVTWRVGATYRNAGRILPTTEPAPYATVETVRQEITVGDLSGRLLPAVPTPREVSGARVAYDLGTGTLIRPDGLTPGLRYTVTSARERPDNNLLATANTPAGDAVARVLHVPDGAPEQLRRLATQLAEENGAPYARAAAIEQWLAEHYRLVADAPSGHAYPNLAFFLFGPRNGGGQRGTSEQFAASFAVLGRLAGLPTRVVVGFAAPGSGPVRAADAYAWPEVLFDGLGWVSFDPLPRPDEEPRPVEEDFRPQPEDPPPSEQPEPTLEPTASPPAQGRTRRRQRRADAGACRWHRRWSAARRGGVAGDAGRAAPGTDPGPTAPGRPHRRRLAGADRHAATGRSAGRRGPVRHRGRHRGPRHLDRSDPSGRHHLGCARSRCHCRCRRPGQVDQPGRFRTRRGLIGAGRDGSRGGHHLQPRAARHSPPLASLALVRAPRPTPLAPLTHHPPPTYPAAIMQLWHLTIRPVGDLSGDPTA